MDNESVSWRAEWDSDPLPPGVLPGVLPKALPAHIGSHIPAPLFSCPLPALWECCD